LLLVEAWLPVTHIVNIAPQSVSGHLVRVVVEENDRVEQGQVLAEIDPVPYRDQVNIGRSKVDTAQAELRRQTIAGSSSGPACRSQQPYRTDRVIRRGPNKRRVNWPSWRRAIIRPRRIENG
jgi:multidrug resistance efflux pump